MGNRASPKILKQITIEYDIYSVFSTRVEAMEMLKIMQKYFNIPETASGAQTRRKADTGCLHTRGCITDWMYSATARTEMEQSVIEGVHCELD